MEFILTKLIFSEPEILVAIDAFSHISEICIISESKENIKLKISSVDQSDLIKKEFIIYLIQLSAIRC